jgi:5-methylcytosine-specific restriction endonuclease McrA
MTDSDKSFVPTRLSDYSKESILQEIRRVVLEECNGIVPKRDRFVKLARVSPPAIAKRFGSYINGIRQAGFSPHRQSPRPVITKEAVKTNLYEVLKKSEGYCFSQTFYRKHGGNFCEETVKARLGVSTWPDVMRAIGAKPKPRIRHTVVSQKARRRRFLADLSDADLIAEIGRLWKQKGRRPSHSEFQRESRIGISVYRTRYGSWTKAIEAFSKAEKVPVQGLARARPTKGILLDELRAIRRKYPDDILTHDFYKKRGGTYSRSVFFTRFGSWTAAVNAVGGISGVQARYSRTDLFDEIQRLWEQLGQQPRQIDMAKLGRFSPNCYKREFGSWTKAIHAFCEDRNNADNEQSEECIAEDDCASPADSSFMQSEDKAPENAVCTHLISHRTGRTVSDRLRFKVLNRDHFTCKLCGRSPSSDPGLKLEVDHIHPYSRGGETELDNLQTSCRQCNRGKANSGLNLPRT